jgi:RHS repeat-associated protein
MRAITKGGQGRRVSSFLARVTIPALAIALGCFLGSQGPAAALESHTAKPPRVYASAEQAPEKPALPKAPVQVAMPAPPPIKYFPGLEESLVAMGPVTEEENKDLDIALKSFHDTAAKAAPGSDFDDYVKPLQAFITLHPQSKWNAALYLDIGMGYYRAGYYSKVFEPLEKSWQLGRNAQNPQAHLMIDRAVGELARMHARLGHAKELEALFADLGKRPIGGPATELIQGAREGLWGFHENPGESYLCGPFALKNLLTALNATADQIRLTTEARSGTHGFSLPELAKLADKTKLKYALIRREPGQPIPVPSVINWSVHHYAAITGKQDGVFELADPTFGDAGGSITAKAIDAEQSGYFLVPESVMKANPKAGWQTVAADSPEAKAVYGMGNGINNAPSETNHNSCKAHGMTVCNAHTMVVSLNLTDTPLGYAPQKGQPVFVQLSYNQREAMQPAIMGYSNVGPKWSISTLSFIQDNPASANNQFPVTHIPGGGGGMPYANSYNANTGSYQAEYWDNSTGTKVPVNGQPSYYTRALPDGSMEKYSLSNGAATAPRNWFLTTATDPAGNVTTYNYDTTFRLTSIVDAMGRSTTFTYGLTSYPLLITQITDPFGRTTQLTYDTSQRLASITDPVGITSSFTYSTAEPTFITQLTTPYGNSTFSDTPDASDPVVTNTRSLTMTDPLGYTDYLYFYENTSIVPASDPTATVPTGMNTYNFLNEWRNTFYWDKHAFALGVTMSGGVVTAHDYSKAFITHWTHDPLNINWTGFVPESVKPPLENRTWFNYPAQSSPFIGGTLNRQTAAGRVLDNGTTQLSKATYSTNHTPTRWGVNQLLTSTDPLGRTTQYTYDTNNVDLLTVQQLTTSPSTYTTIATYGSYTTGHHPQTYTDAAGKIWNFAWNGAGQISTVTDPNSGVTTYNYDTAGRLSSITNANSQTQVSYTYDSADRVRTKTDSQGYVLTYDYDNLDRVTKVTYPDATTDLYDYNFQSGTYAGTPSLELRKHTDRLGRVTTYDYDADQRLTSVTEPTSGTGTRTTQYQYYENGTLKDIIDANGNDTHWDIDIESRPTKKTYAYGTSAAKYETYTYESTTSRLKSITDALGQVKTFTYGLDNQVTGITYTSSVNATPNVTFGWDTYFPRLSSMTDGTGTTNYSYTAIGTNGALKLSSIAGPFSNDTIGLTYDALGRLSGRNITGGNETFGYDAISRLTSHGTPLGTFTETYLGQTGQMASQSVTNGATTVSTNWGYDTNANDRRLISITNSGVTRSYTLGYGTSPVNPYDIQSITDTAATGHPWATQTHSYTYDLIDRLTAATQTTPGNFAYAYDPLDNATTVTTPSGTVSPSPTYNANNQLATFGANSYTYDANGNTLSGDGTKTYKWDAENRLIEIDYVGTSNKSVFTYNGIGQRRIDAETIGGTTATTRYLWCGTFVCQTRDGFDNVLRRDLQEGEYNVSSGQKLVYARDQIKSVRDVIDAITGNLIQSYDFTPYGGISRSNGSAPTDFQYAGFFNHLQSGLSLATYRPYDAATGRWLTRDPLREDGAFNLYAYASANPLMWTDETGLQAVPLPIPGTPFPVLPGTPQNRHHTAPLFPSPSDTYHFYTAFFSLMAHFFNCLPVWFNDDPENPVTTIPDAYPPFRGNPGTTTVGGKQSRRYGDDGYPGTDRDKPHGGGHDDTTGSGDHSHDWGRPPGGGPPTNEDRGPSRLPKPGDPPPPSDSR